MDEAQKVFLTRGDKTAQNYMERHKMFHLDAGWVSINFGRTEKIVSSFNQTDFDPRELMLLFPELYNRTEL